MTETIYATAEVDGLSAMPGMARNKEQPGDKDPATYSPPLASLRLKCWINVKHRYGLTVDSAEETAMRLSRASGKASTSLWTPGRIGRDG
ncbi:hypothetical protein [Actinomadura litoris]|uniref:hypothetical protein n=1 Tax=Actinomadura litoris TaxID=2678616 RepID=UPI001FA7ACE2|nr:hypothetical protein [Actinomadura litoris]